jgi:1,4-alpha-glucan branching enzyme
MPGWIGEKFGNLRALYGYMWARPGKKLLFMGSEFGQWHEWDHDSSLQWHYADSDGHGGLRRLVADLNRHYREQPALWEADTEPAGFQWVDLQNADENIIAFLRIASSGGRRILCVCNFAPILRKAYRVGAPIPGWYRELLNTDSEFYGGGNLGNGGGVNSDPVATHGFNQSIEITLPPLATIWFEVPG